MMDDRSQKTDTNRFRLVRCMDWLQKQNHPKKLAQQNKNDIQFIIETNAHRKKFLLSAAEDDATVPAGVDETAALQPKAVPTYRLRFDGLSMECEWQSCRECYGDYKEFQDHIIAHASEVEAVNNDEEVTYSCLWDVCGFKTPDFDEMLRHINYHSYHARLLAIGFNARATLKLESCRRDSSKRNQLPQLKDNHTCLWFECDSKFNSFQKYIDHVLAHVKHIEKNLMLCSWAGCGVRFNRRALLTMHVRSHTGEKLIACYHCGRHFSSNHKLSTHLARQNSAQECGYQCTVCGKWYATEYLVREHSRQHVSYYACSLCDMSAPTRAAIAVHMRYRHLDADAVKTHACTQCDYKAVIQFDLEKHMKTHNKKRKKTKGRVSSDDSTDEGDNPAKKVKKEIKKYACHLCPTKKTKIFSRGHRLTTHLVNVHGAQWPFGHSRFRYQISDDGMYRLTTTRIEDLEVSKKIVGGNSIPKESLDPKYDFDVKRVREATKCTPVKFEITLKGGRNGDSPQVSVKNEADDGDDTGVEIKNDIKGEMDDNDDNKYNVNDLVEICMYDVDESGNIISSETTIQVKNDFNDFVNVSVSKDE